MRARVIRIIMLIVALVMTGCEQPATEVPLGEDLAPEGTIVAMGDSLTAGLGVEISKSYPELLKKQLLAAGYRYEVINAGVSGETSSGALSRLSWILKMNPDIVILETGANDGFRGLPTSLIQDNIRAIIQQLEERNITVVLTGMMMVSNLGDEYTQAFQEVYVELSREYDVIFMPFFLEGVATRPELNRPDGIHPNSEGYQIIADNITPYVLEAIKRLSRPSVGQ